MDRVFIIFVIDEVNFLLLLMEVRISVCEGNRLNYMKEIRKVRLESKIYLCERLFCY